MPPILGPLPSGSLQSTYLKQQLNTQHNHHVLYKTLIYNRVQRLEKQVIFRVTRECIINESVSCVGT